MLIFLEFIRFIFAQISRKYSMQEKLTLLSIALNLPFIAEKLYNILRSDLNGASRSNVAVSTWKLVNDVISSDRQDVK